MPAKKRRTSASRAKGLSVPAWPPAPAADQDQPVDPMLRRLLGMAQGGDIVEDQPAIAMGGGDDIPRRLQAGDDEGHLLADADLGVMRQALIGWVDDEIDTEGRHGRLRMPGAIGIESPTDLGDPARKLLLRPRIEGGEAADDSRLALGDHQRRGRDDEHRRADDRQRQTPGKGFRYRHQSPIRCVRRPARPPSNRAPAVCA